MGAKTFFLIAFVVILSFYEAGVWYCRSTVSDKNNPHKPNLGCPGGKGTIFDIFEVTAFKMNFILFVIILCALAYAITRFKRGAKAFGYVFC
jgi:hypothetical protein